MRFLNRLAFEKHLEGGQLCRAYGVAARDEGERRELVRLVAQKIQAQGHEPSEVAGGIDRFFTPRLFGGEAVAVVHDADKWPKGELEGLKRLLEGGMAEGFLVVGVGGKTPLLGAVEKVGVVLDLLDEKPWDLEKRLLAELAQKGVERRAAELLLERVGPDPALLRREVEKLSLFYGEKGGPIRADAVEALTGRYKEAGLWQEAEGFVWERKMVHLTDSAQFYPLVAAIRFQLEWGWQVAELSDLSPAEIAQKIGKSSPRQVEKRLEAIRSKNRKVYFRRALDAVFQAELASRSTPFHPAATLTLLAGVVWGN